MSDKTAPEEMWLHWIGDDQDEAPFQWQLSAKRIDDNSVRYVRADKYVKLEAALGVQEIKDKRIAVLEAQVASYAEDKCQLKATIQAAMQELNKPLLVKHT